MGKEKITVRQVFKLLICMSLGPAVRVVPLYVSKVAAQAGWLGPVVIFLPIFLFLKILTRIFSVYREESYSQIICDILGGVMGKLVLFIYLIGMTILTGFYIRAYATRINLSLTPTARIHVEVISMLLLVYVVVRYGLVLLTRMGEIIFAVTVISFIVFFLLSANNIRVDRLTPISYRDIVPIFKAGYGVGNIWGFITFICFYSDRITEKDELASVGYKYLIFFIVVTTMLNIMVIGSLGYSVVSRTSLPFFVAIKNISLFNIIERIEALAISQWIAIDFVLIAIFVFVTLRIISDLFNIGDFNYLIKMVFMFFYILTFFISMSMFDLQDFSIQIAIHMITILGLGLPILIYIVGRIRKKI